MRPRMRCSVPGYRARARKCDWHDSSATAVATRDPDDELEPAA
jgi:hypothetical protein